jgi:PAS domain S-box-containing protein
MRRKMPKRHRGKWRRADRVRQRQAECDLLHSIIDHIPRPVFVFLAPDGRRWIRNRGAALCDAGPMRRGPSFGDPPLRRPDGSVYEADQYPVARALKGETVLNEEVLVESGGALHRFSTSNAPIRDAGGSVVAVVGTCDDVTAVRRAEAEHAETIQRLLTGQRLFSRIADATPDVLYLFDLQTGRNVYQNQRLLPALGYEAPEFQTIDPLGALVHPDDRARVQAALERFDTLADGEVLRLECRLLHKNGTYRWFRSRALVFNRDDRSHPLLILGLSEDITERKRKQEDMRRIQQDLEHRVAERTAQLMRIEEETRHRIARELHDEMGQHVTALKVGLEGLGGRADDQPRIEQLTAIVHDLDEHIDRLAHELRPAALDDFGLDVALANSIELFTERSGIAVDFHHSELHDGRLPAMIENTLYRLVQEALTNVMKHARARSVSVILERRENQVQLIVEDDGVGFNVDEALHRGLGLRGMRERVELAGGTFHIESRVGGGTSIFVRLTLRS